MWNGSVIPFPRVPHPSRGDFSARPYYPIPGSLRHRAGSSSPRYKIPSLGVRGGFSPSCTLSLPPSFPTWSSSTTIKGALFYDVTLWSDLQIPGSLTTAFPLTTCLEDGPFRPAARCLFYPRSAQPSDLKRHLEMHFPLEITASNALCTYMLICCIYHACILHLSWPRRVLVEAHGIFSCGTQTS